MQNFAKFRRLPPAERRLAVHMFCLTVAVRLGLVLLTLKAVRRWLKTLAKTYQIDPGRLNVERTAYLIGLISWKMLRDGPCLTQALAMQWMLERAGRPAKLMIGVTKPSGSRLQAHAWVESDGEVVIGGPVDRYTIISSDV